MAEKAGRAESTPNATTTAQGRGWGSEGRVQDGQIPAFGHRLNGTARGAHRRVDSRRRGGSTARSLHEECPRRRVPSALRRCGAQRAKGRLTEGHGRGMVKTGTLGQPELLRSSAPLSAYYRSALGGRVRRSRGERLGVASCTWRHAGEAYRFSLEEGGLKGAALRPSLPHEGARQGRGKGTAGQHPGKAGLAVL